MKGPGEGRTPIHNDHWDFSQTQEPFRTTVPQEALARNPVRFAGLMDVYGAFPFGKMDADGKRLAANVNNGMTEMASYRSLFDTEPAGETVTLRPDYDYQDFDRKQWAKARKKAAEQRAKAAQKRT